MPKLSSNYIIKKLLAEDIYYFTPEFLENFLEVEREKVYNVLKTLRRKDLVERVEKGKYIVLGFEPEKVLSNPLFIGYRAVSPSYVSFWNALNFYGFTEQVPRKFFFVTTKRKDLIEFRENEFQYTKFSPEKFFGYQKRGDELKFLIADEEKSIIDSLFLPRYAGGIKEVFKSLQNSLGEIDLKILQDYGLRMGSKSLCARLGYMLDKLGESAEKVRKKLPKSYIKLDSSREKGQEKNDKWKIYENTKLKVI